ncbi:hypothetical protein J6590_037554 [Homalodisca vitripennis]|nr:hypothetical protein J6590_037554 [Homalodisca vitripennis]
MVTLCAAKNLETAEAARKLFDLVFTLTLQPPENEFAHGVWDSLADYPVNPLRATEGPGRNPFG